MLAGFLVAIPPAMVEAFPYKIINIHQSLIPSFCGKGFYGLKVHEAALARGVKVTGATVHFVDEGTDTGRIILQKPVMVEDGDTAPVLQKRVMEQAEWIIQCYRRRGYEVKKALSLDYRHWIISVRLPYSERPPRASRTFQQRIWR